MIRVPEIQKRLQNLGKDISRIDESWAPAQQIIDETVEALEILGVLNGQDTNVPSKWIPCSERMPEEHDSIFAKFKGTDRWMSEMYEKESDLVNVTIRYEDGTKQVKTIKTIDGKWRKGTFSKSEVLAWMPLPEAY